MNKLKACATVHIAVGLLLFGAIICVVFATGSTFGQRASRLYEKDTVEWQREVARLNAGCKHVGCIYEH